MRRSSRLHCMAVVALGLLFLAGPDAAHAEIERADPLFVPTDPVLQPEDAVDLIAFERLEQGAASLREHGYPEAPFIARAYLELARETGDAQLIDRGLELAPWVPGVRFEGAWLARDPLEMGRALVALAKNFPGVLWLLTAGGWALGVAMIATSCLLLVLGFARAAPLHGHAFGHLALPQDPPGWPGVLLLLALVCGLTALGVGPVAVLGLAGGIAAVRLRRAEALVLCAALSLIALAVGPGLDLWGRVGAGAAQRDTLVAAWRVERGHELPGDVERLQRVIERDPTHLQARVALAAARKRAGQLPEALALLPELPTLTEPTARAVVLNMRGSLHLARGEVRQAIVDLEQARSAQESAGVLFNLSQAYGRALRLIDQTPTFNAARQLDADLVGRYTRGGGSNLHTYLIPLALPVTHHFRLGLAASLDGMAMAERIRTRLLGEALPGAIWIALPLLGLLGLALRSGSISRCSRCERAMCSRCAPDANQSTTCVRCLSLFARRDDCDARVRKHQLEIDRRRQRLLSWRIGILGLVIPGLVSLHEGSLLRGCAVAGAAVLGAALLGVAGSVPVPWELGTLAGTTCRFVGWSLLAVAFLFSLAKALRRISYARSLS